ncbi:MAG: TonB-dependent receptor [Prevotella sp.]|nr:TonB-dependent receptor [Prevotella sp.]
MNKTFLYTMLFVIALIPQHMKADEGEKREKKHGTIHGLVVNSKDKATLPHAYVTVEGTNIGSNTNISGQYELNNVPEGNVVIEVRHMGFRTATKQVEIKAGSKTEANFELSEDAISIDEVVVSSNRNMTLRREASTLVNVLDTRLFNITHSMNMCQSLNFQPGVRTEDNCQNCGFTQVRINGLDGHYSQILIDSRPIFSALNGVYGLEQIPTNMIERIEVVRGGGSSLYGASAIGGTINIITKEPTRNSAEVAHTITSIKEGKTMENNTTANLSLVSDDRKAGFYLYGQHHYRPGVDYDGDNYTELPNLHNNTIGLSTFYKFTPYSKLTLQYHSLHEFRRGGNHLHLTPHEANIAEQLEHDINGGNLAYDFLSDNGKHILKTYLSIQNTERKSYYGGIGEGISQEDMDNARKAYGRTQDLTYILGAQYAFNMEKLLYIPATLTLGTEYNHNHLKDEISGYNHLLDQKVRIWSVYMQNEWKNEKWGLLIGGRIDKHNMIEKAIFSPRINLRFNFAKDINLRLTYADGFRAPQAFDEDLHIGLVGGERVVTRHAQGLKEERSHSFSLSCDFYQRFGNIQTNLLVEGFHTRLNNVFGLRQLDEKDEYGNIIQERYNANKAKVFGINLEGKAAFTSWFQLQAGITLQKSEYGEPVEWNEEAPKEKRMMRTPNTYGYFTASLTPFKHFTAALSGNYTGSMLIGHATGSGVDKPVAVNTPSFLTLNIKLSYDIAVSQQTAMQLNGGIQNLTNAYQKDFDKGWARDAGYIYGPATPRCFYMGMKFTY